MWISFQVHKNIMNQFSTWQRLVGRNYTKHMSKKKKKENKREAYKQNLIERV